MTGRELKAIGVYAREHDLKLSLSAYPQITFLNGSEIVMRPIDGVLSFYDSYRKQQAKERVKQRRAEQAKVIRSMGRL